MNEAVLHFRRSFFLYLAELTIAKGSGAHEENARKTRVYRSCGGQETDERRVPNATGPPLGRSVGCPAAIRFCTPLLPEAAFSHKPT